MRFLRWLVVFFTALRRRGRKRVKRSDTLTLPF
jgi:hypothetical protein